MYPKTKEIVYINNPFVPTNEMKMKTIQVTKSYLHQ